MRKDSSEREPVLLEGATLNEAIKVAHLMAFTDLLEEPGPVKGLDDPGRINVGADLGLGPEGEAVGERGLREGAPPEPRLLLDRVRSLG